jgi:integrase
MGAIMGAINALIDKMAELTQKELEALKPQQNGERLADGDSTFGIVRTTKRGLSVDFEWRYSFDGKVRQVRLGSWPKTNLKLLRDKRDILLGKLKSGIDPLAIKEIERLKNKADRIEAKQAQTNRLQELATKNARITIRELFELWLSTDLKNRKDSGKEALRAFERDVFPIIGDLAVEEVNKTHIQHIIDLMLKRGVKRMTTRVLSDLRQLFGFAIDREYIEADPTARIKKHKIGGNTERERYLTESELTLLFEKLPISGLMKTSQIALLIQLSTITRISEILGAKWQSIDFERQIWTIPDTKNGKAHIIQLSSFAMNQFESLRQQSGLTEWIFPAANLTQPVGVKTITKQVMDRQRTNGKPLAGRTKQTDSLTLKNGKWVPHDLRRTGATLMAELGVLPEVIERCLNHTESSKIKRIYQRPQYESPMREAWDRLGQRLTLLMNKPNNVVVLKQSWN